MLFNFAIYGGDMNRDLLKLASDAMRSLMNGRHFGTGQTGHYLNIISKIENELNRPQPEQEEVKVDIGVDVTAEGTSVVAFNCRADGARECFYAEWHPLAKPEQTPFKPDWASYRQGVADGAAQPEQEPVCDKDPFYCWSIRCQLGKVCKHTAPPRKEWVGLTQEEVQEIAKQLINDAAYCSTHFAIAIEAELRRKNNAV